MEYTVIFCDETGVMAGEIEADSRELAETAFTSAFSPRPYLLRD